MSCWISESEESGCDVRKEGKERERRGKGEEGDSDLIAILITDSKK